MKRIVALRPALAPRQQESLRIKVLELDAKTHADMQRTMDVVAHVTSKTSASEAL